MKAITALFCFFCFFPYPGIPVGSYTGLQISFFLCSAVAPLFLFRKEIRRGTFVYLMLLVVYALSGAIAMLRGSAIIVPNTYKILPVWALSTMPIILVGPLIAGARVRIATVACATAVAIHGGFALIQWFAFRQGVFPLFEIFNNNSFSLAGQVDLGRPMGYFPEPSAMAASIGPFIMLFIIMIVDREIYRNLPKVSKMLIVAGAVLGGMLLILSKTGYIIPFGLVLALVIILGSPSMLKGRFLVKAAIYTAYILLIGFASYIAIDIFSERLTAELSQSGSWSGRIDSIIVGVTIWCSDFQTFLWGLGANQAHLHMENTGTYQTFGGVTRFGAIYSVLFTYLVETGLLGCVSVAIIAGIALRSIARSGFRLGGAAVLACWAAGVGATTSYFMLPSLWLALGMLVYWEHIFPKSQTKALDRTLHFQEQRRLR